MSFSLINLVPFLAATIGIVSLLQVLRTPAGLGSSRRKDIDRFGPDWDCGDLPLPAVPAPTRFEMVESAIAFACAVLSLEAICFLLYMQYVSPNPDIDIVPWMNNPLVYVGLSILSLGGFLHAWKTWR